MGRSGVIVAAVLCGIAGIASSEPIGTAFTYQGELRDGDEAANGVYDMRFRVYADALGVVQFGPTLCVDNVEVVDGRFTTPLDFGAAFDGVARYLEVDVRGDTGLSCGDSSGFATLSPRQRVSAAPSATYASNAGNATTAATATSATSAITANNAITLNNQSPSFYTNAANLTGTMSDARLSANVTTLAGSQSFIGTKTFAVPPAFNSGGVPFTVAATNKVTNLNADLLDGLDSTAFAASAHTHDASGIVSGLLGDARLSTNIPRLNTSNTFTGANRFDGFTSVNRSSPVSGSDVFALQNPVGGTGYTGMYVASTDAAAGKPFYGYSVNGLGSWTYVDPNGFWRLDHGGTRMAVARSSGNVGLGVADPQVRLDMAGADTAMRLRNSNDAGGGFVQNTFGTLQLGMFNPSASTWGAIPANTSRALLGMENTGRVGTLTNTGLQPAWRNTIDDGAGNASFAGNVAANNMPAIKIVTGDASGSFTGNSVTLIETVPVNVPASGYLRITARCRISLIAYSVFRSTATLELKDTTSGEVTVKAVPLGVAGGAPTASGQSYNGDVTLEYLVPVGAGARSYKLRLLHSAGSGTDAVSYSLPEVTVMYFPQGL